MLFELRPLYMRIIRARSCGRLGAIQWLPFSWVPSGSMRFNYVRFNYVRFNCVSFSYLLILARFTSVARSDEHRKD